MRKKTQTAMLSTPKNVLGPIHSSEYSILKTGNQPRWRGYINCIVVLRIHWQLLGLFATVAQFLEYVYLVVGVINGLIIRICTEASTCPTTSVGWALS
jgi:hypothetical protein